MRYIQTTERSKASYFKYYCVFTFLDGDWHWKLCRRYPTFCMLIRYQRKKVRNKGLLFCYQLKCDIGIYGLSDIGPTQYLTIRYQILSFKYVPVEDQVHLALTWKWTLAWTWKIKRFLHRILAKKGFLRYQHFFFGRSPLQSDIRQV